MTSVSMLLGNVSSGYPVKNSLRFRSSASAYLNRTPASASNRTTWTWSAWLKRGSIGTGAEQWLFGAENTTIDILLFDTSDRLQVTIASSTVQLTTTQVFRDPSAWYHFVWAMDTTQATAANRMKLYVNGAQITSFSTASYPAQNYQTWVDLNVLHEIGRRNNGTAYFDGYMAEVNFIDGQALTPSSFGTYDSNGVWQPINYSGSYGTNGFHLTFGNTTSTTTLGYDTSGNSNNWTTNNISLTAGSTYDSMTDSPTVTSASVANYAVGNPLAKSGSITLSEANLTAATTSGATEYGVYSTIGVQKGKWYFEVKNNNTNDRCIAGFAVGGLNADNLGALATGNNGFRAFNTTANATQMIAVDMDAGKGWSGINGTWTGDPASGTGASYTFTAASPFIAFFGGFQDVASCNVSANFGQRPFTYTPPTGFNALNTYNLPTPTIANGAQYMAASLYTGNGSAITLTNGGNNTIGTTFQPDFVWQKARSTTSNNFLSDSVRGINKVVLSDSTLAEVTSVQYVTSFNSNGFSFGNDTGINTNGTTYVAWQWKAAGSTASNTNGSITSTVSANTTAGFSVVTYTGTGANATVGHGLGVAPSMVFYKIRSSADGWGVYHTSLGNTQALFLNETSVAATSSTYWNNTSPTSTTLSIGTWSRVNLAAGTFVAYCWAAIPGFSAFGSYVGNGSADGPFIYTGFRPRFILFKRTDTVATNWNIIDTSRDPYNIAGQWLEPNATTAETTYPVFDVVSNGFKNRSTYADTNPSGGTIIYAAFAENPFQSSRAR
jgi:hypothetical protein